MSGFFGGVYRILWRGIAWSNAVLYFCGWWVTIAGAAMMSLAQAAFDYAYDQAAPEVQ